MPSEGKPTTPRTVLDLVERFARNFDAYKSSHYNETQVRREFLDPFFKALGWDVDNEQGYAEAYKDVIHEDAIKVGEATKAPDYCFRIGGARKFFLEAKRPSTDIKNDPVPAYQLRRYAWTTKLPLSILTDFEEFSVYDCRVKPDQKDHASAARVLYVPYFEYSSRWDEIANIFSRDAVLKGSFDRYAESTKVKRGTAAVDDAFLQTIETWRRELAENLALRNKYLSQRELNFAVQRIIDRIIFLRICEGRGIEDYGKLQLLAEENGIYKRLGQLFREADDRYNSGLFHFKPERDRHEPPDELTLNLNLDDKLLGSILKGLYYPESPYVFSALPADVLGHVYEQFLGKVIRLTEGHRAKVDDKPEVKKAGGVYYTPTYIVEYIVQNTIGRLLEGKTSKQASKLKILDPACGSGSFLLGAYEYLLKWHLDFYTRDEPTKWAKGSKPALVQAAGSGWKLTIPERKRILLENIYGADIDAQAVETTKLSLLLKVLEGETQQTLQPVLRVFQERALPDLGDNIKCGNSLIGPDFYQQQLLELDAEERYRINVFDWKSEFPLILGSGGFDVVIGNPPYIDVKELPSLVKAELSRTFRSATQRFDLYVPFVERGLALLSKDGFLSFILPSMFMRREYGSALRKLILEEGEVWKVVDFGTNQIFKGPLNYVAILVLGKQHGRKTVEINKFTRTGLTASEIKKALTGAPPVGVSSYVVPSGSLTGLSEWQLLNDTEAELSKRLFRNFEPLGRLVKFASEGIHSGKDEVFFVPSKTVKALKLEHPPVFPLAKGKDIHRYEDVDRKVFLTSVVYPYDLATGEVLSTPDLATKAPNTWAYLQASRAALKGRPYFERSSKLWYELWCPRDPELYMNQKIVGPEIANCGEFTLARKPLFVNNKLKVIVLKDKIDEAPEYFLGLLNSSLLTHLHRLIAPPKGNNYFEVKTRILGTLPIRRIDFSNKSDRVRHDHMVKLVEQMLDLHRRLVSAKTPQEKISIERQISATDTQIDHLVYDTYGLTEEEIRVVEASCAGNPESVSGAVRTSIEIAGVP